MKKQNRMELKKNEMKCQMMKEAQKSTDTEGERKGRSDTRTAQRLVCTLHDGKRPHPSPRGKTKKQGSVKKAHHRHGLLLHEIEVCTECPNDLRRIDNLHCGEGRQTSEHHEQRCVEKGSSLVTVRSRHRACNNRVQKSCS